MRVVATRGYDGRARKLFTPSRAGRRRTGNCVRANGMAGHPGHWRRSQGASRPRRTRQERRCAHHLLRAHLQRRALLARRVCQERQGGFDRMPRGVKSASSSRRSKPKASALGRRLVAGLSEALAHARGELALSSYTVTVPEHVDVAKLLPTARLVAIRIRAHLRARRDRASRLGARPAPARSGGARAARGHSQGTTGRVACFAATPSLSTLPRRMSCDARNPIFGLLSELRDERWLMNGEWPTASTNLGGISIFRPLTALERAV